MIGEIRFKLPEEQDEWNDAVNGWKWHVVVHNMDDQLRNRIKHGDEKGSYQEARDLLNELLDDLGLDLLE